MLDAAKAMKLSSKDLLDLKIIDEIIPEPIGGAHRDRNLILSNVRASISKNLEIFKEMSPEDILNQRKNKFLKIGRSKGFISDLGNLSETEIKKSSLDQFFKKKENIFFTVGAILLIVISLVFFL